MSSTEANKIKRGRERMVIRKCHVCGAITEAYEEIKRCSKCKKCFLPSHYLQREAAKTSKEFYQMYASSQELDEEDLVKGIYVIW